MLHKIELLVAGSYVEVLPVIGQVFSILFALFIGKGHAALFYQRADWLYIIYPQATV